MDEEKNKIKQKIKEVLKPTKIMAYTALVIVLIIILLIGSIYTMNKNDFIDLAENAETYSGNAMIGAAAEGIVSYVKDEEGNYVKDEQGDNIRITPVDIAKEINNISRYLKDDSESTKEEKLGYLLNAGLVTKFPYIKDLAKDKVNGIVKFYRYSEESQAQDENQEQYLLTFIDEENFNNKLNAGDSDIFNFFTIDENQQLVIACKSTTTKTITTNDPEITEDVINEVASDTYASNGNGIYTMEETIITKQSKDYQSIIEQYTMPFNVLAALLVQTGEYNFVKELADMLYESQINIGIYENATITTKTEDYTYKKRVEFSPSTELDFSDVNSQPPITASKYPNTVISCIADIQVDQETQAPIVTHTSKKLDGSKETKVASNELKTKYIKAISDGIITELADQASDAKIYETKYYSETETRTSITFGTILVDTWMARWESEYVGEIDNPPSQPNTGTEPNAKRTITYINSSSKLFGGTALRSVEEELSVHTNNLKNDAKYYILDNTNFEKVARTMTASDIRTHAESCTSSPTCGAKLSEIYNNLWQSILPEQVLVNSVKTNNALSQVKEHVQDILDKEAVNKSKQAENNFKNQLKNIGHTQYPVVAKSNVDINFSTTNTRNSTTYKQDSIERTNDGEKFKKLFNNIKFHNSRQAILERIQWFWEYIREYEETAKFENVLRYLLNIATGSNQFGNFSEEDIENLFKAFEPKELQNVSSMGHLQAFAEWLKSYENEDLRKYMNGEGSYKGDAVKSVTEDKQFGKMYLTDHDGCLNYTYGIVVRFKNGTTNNKSYFEKYGYDVDALLREYDSGGEALVPMEVLENIKLDLIKDKYNSVKTNIENYKDNGIELDVTMVEYQYYALTSVTYQYGNCGQGIQGPNNPAALYKKYYIDEENPEGFRQNAVSKDGHGNLVHYFTGSNYSKRKENTWILFNEGRYILNNGEEIYASGAGTVAEFAQQFVGLTAPQITAKDGTPFFKYCTSDGTQFCVSEWCAMFVSFCFDQCGMIESIGGGYLGCSTKVRQTPSFITTKYGENPDFIPQAGDVIFFDYSETDNVRSDHTGIVYKCDGTYVYTIEGNTGNKDETQSEVSAKKYTINYSTILGYIRPE